MTTPFLILAAVMVVAALACVLVPMLRTARRNGRPRAPFVLALLLALAAPPAVLAMYLAIGTPQALHFAPNENQFDLAEATRQLKASLTRKPGDAQGWMLLAEAYSKLEQPREARDALEHLMKLKPDDPDVMVAWAEAVAQTSPDHRIDDAARAKLQQALRINPSHQRALWLLGISDFQRGQYADAAQRWKTLLPLLEPGSKVAATVQQQLAEAEHRAGSSDDATPAAPDANPTTAGAAAAPEAALKVTVQLAPNLTDRVKPGDTLFVFARAVDGPSMPLAVARVSASTWPAEVTLTDAMAMTPRLKLSEFSKVQVAARISSSGNAMPQPGDLESTPVQVHTGADKPVAVTIDRVD